jgi:WhiB family redox-sensing transcriptional regulator
MTSTTAPAARPGRLALVQVLDSARRARRGTPCADDPEKWFTDETNIAAVNEAKAGCTGCPVRSRCLRLALDSDERFGIWGGTTASERQRAAGPGRAVPAAASRELEVASA